MTSEPLPARAEEYIRCLRYRGYPPGVVFDHDAGLAEVYGLLGEAVFRIAPEQARLVGKQLVAEGISADRAEELQEIVASYLQWQAEPVKPLTDERIEELAALATQEGVTVPTRQDVGALLNAPDLSTRAGLRDALAMRFAAHWGMGTPDICAVDRFDVELSVYRQSYIRMHVRCDDRVLSLNVLCAETLDEVREKLPDEGPLFITRGGRRITPRALQERVKYYVSQLGEELSEPLTLQRLRDHAVARNVECGATYEDVASRLGYATTGSVRRRYNRLPWRYLADREGQWFPLEVAAEAEGIELKRLERQWTVACLLRDGIVICSFARKMCVITCIRTSPY